MPKNQPGIGSRIANLKVGTESRIDGQGAQANRSDQKLTAVVFKYSAAKVL